ncbi:MAG: zinc-ribbon domain-containing protein, partial [Clostridiales bacterium]|nr:zinc-ribbon domain-containing protein [Clostridiales bacterium]
APLIAGARVGTPGGERSPQTVQPPEAAPVTAQPPESCPRCGTVRKEGVRFCPVCGFDYEGAAAPETGGEPRL